MPEPAITFKCLGHTKRDDGSIEHYDLEVTETFTDRTVTISIEPRHLASTRSMKRILLDRCMFYRATRGEHDQMLRELLVSQPALLLQ